MAVSLVNYGSPRWTPLLLPACRITTPTVSALRTLRGYGVDVSHVRLGESVWVSTSWKRVRLSPSKVIYDRKYSAISTAAPGDFD